ncbi:MAG: flagellar protein, partial [Cellulosilyticaceae bacterium]
SCKRCKNLFQYVSGKSICPHCLKREEEMFMKVKDFLKTYPGAQIQEVYEETGVSIQMIESFIREGRLEVSASSPIGLPCERCGAVIRTGRYCKECSMYLVAGLNQMSEGFKTQIPKENQDSRAKMRFLGETKVRK